METKRNLSPLSLLWISLTSMIGSGWLFGSLYSAHYAGPAAIVAWPLAGFLLLFVALTYAEIGTMFPNSYTLARLPLYTHGRLTSIILSSLTWISLATIPVIETQGLLQYASNYFPEIILKDGIRYTTSKLGYLIALLLLLSFVYINYFGVRIFSRINTGFTLWKLLIPTITIIALLTANNHPQNFHQFGGFMPYGWHGVMAAMSSGGILFSLLGFRQVIIMMGETENPSKYVPIVLISSLIVTSVLYAGLQWTFIASMRAEDLAHGWANLSFKGMAGPFAAIAELAGLLWLSGLLYLDAFISPYSTGLVYTTTAANMLSAMSETGDAPTSLATKNSYQVPWLSLCVNFILAAAMFFLLRDWQAMAAFLVSALMVSYAVGPVCFICLRKQLPHFSRPFRLRCGNFIAFLGFYICTAGVYWSGMISVLKLLALTFICLCGYLIYCRIFKKSLAALDIKNSFWLLCYLVSLGFFSWIGNYGGKHLIPPYWDLIYLLIMSFFIFLLAYSSGKQSEHTEAAIKYKGSPLILHQEGKVDV